MTTPTTPQTVLIPGCGAQSLTVAGLIAALQQHVEIDPDRAGQPVQIVPIGGTVRYFPLIAVGAGNDDPEIGSGQPKVMLLATRSPKGF